MNIDESNKIIAFSDEARDLVRQGVEKLSDAVGVTMGPSGKNVLIEQGSAPPILTKDGVTVARAVNLKDRFSNLGVQLVREAAQRTAEEAGDGTTTATVLANAIFQRGLKAIAAGHDIVEIKSGIKSATAKLVEEIEGLAVPVKSDDDLLRVANISVNGESELASLIVSALKSVGDHGSVTVDEAKGFQSSLEVVDGCELDRGYVSPYFVNKPSRMCCELENPAILVTSQKVESLKPIMHFLEQASETKKPFVIISPEVSGDALQAMILNHSKNVIKACVLAAPEFGDARPEALRDLAVLFGTELLSENPSEWRKYSLNSLGRCKKMMSYRFRSVFVDAAGKKEDIDLRIKDIALAARDVNPESEFYNVLSRRRKRLSSGIGILRVGGATEAEIRERKDRVDDALYATQAAIQEGIVPGGGSALAKLAHINSKHERNIGEKILYDAAKEPVRQIARNCGAVSEVILEKIFEKPENYGYNGSTGNICDLFEQGIVDPARVTRLALTNASSVAINLLSIGCAMVREID